MNISALLEKTGAYLLPENLAQVGEAYEYSKNAHGGQLRASGKPYIQHPLTVADILADWKFDAPSIVAALLHDVVEDTTITLEQIKSAFGGEVALLVDGLSKITRLQDIDRDMREAENFRKLLLAAAADWRVVFIKLADRLHNMRTLSAIASPERRRAIAAETQDIYAPIAGRLGFYRVQEELQNLSLRYLRPHRFRVLTKALKNSSTNNRNAISAIEQAIHAAMEKHGIVYKMENRRKNLFSIYRKMENDRLSFAQVEDIIGFRLMVEDRINCYRVLGVLHETFVPIPERFKDFIAIPKSNGYQSLHTRLLSKTGVKIDAQIRTTAMHEVAEHGLAAHWIYKQSGDKLDVVQEEALRQLSSLVRLHEENATAPSDFMENVKIDLSPLEMYILTPKGQILTLPRDATALDMAYLIHTDLGDHAERAIINGQSLPISMRLNSGDQVDIITNPNVSPLPHWLSYAKTARARARIRHILQTTAKQESAAVGKSLLLSTLRKLDFNIQLDDVPERNWRTLLGGNNMKTREELYDALGLGKILPDVAARVLLRRGIKQGESEASEMQPILIAGAGRSAVHLSSCCHPLPFESIIGLLRKERGLVIHSGECLVVRDVNRRSERWIEVQWHEGAGKRLHKGAISLQCHNRPGLITTVSGAISNRDINIVTCNFDGGALEKESMMLDMILEVCNLRQLDELLEALTKMPEVIKAGRKFNTTS